LVIVIFICKIFRTWYWI